MADHIVWTPDDCYDPSHREAVVVVAGRAWRLHQTLGPGYGFQAYHVPYDGHSVHAYTLDDIPHE